MILFVCLFGWYFPHPSLSPNTFFISFLRFRFLNLTGTCRQTQQLQMVNTSGRNLTTLPISDRTFNNQYISLSLNHTSQHTLPTPTPPSSVPFLSNSPTHYFDTPKFILKLLHHFTLLSRFNSVH